MSKVWFTADTHFGHGSIIRYCLRPFLSPEEEAKAVQEPRGKWSVSPETVRRHDDALLQAINAVVAEQDVLWHLGDFCFGDLEDARRYRKRIRCRTVNLVWGNHDRRSLAPLFTETQEQGMIRAEGQEIWLNHYPMRSWNKSFHGSWHLYGHVHGRTAAEDAAHPHWLTRDVGVDACDYRPLSFDDLRRYMAPREEASRKRRAAREAGELDGEGDE